MISARIAWFVPAETGDMWRSGWRFGGQAAMITTGAGAGSLLMADYFDLGGYERRVTTSSKQAQVWFTRGLVWAYGFNHEEAAACFERAIEADPDCALAHWGLAYALGPNYNKPWEAFDPDDLSSSLAKAFAAARAATRASAASPVERALAQALAFRYPSAQPTGNGAAWNADYAN